MSNDRPVSQVPGLAEVSLRYPEKTFHLCQVFNDTTNSYKLFWFLAILTLLKRTDNEPLPLAGIFTEMAVLAWHPVCLYRLSLGRQDKLQDIILEIKNQSALAPNAGAQAIRRFAYGSVETQSKLEYLSRYVPTRFLNPWFSEQLRGVQDDTVRTRAIRTMAKDSQRTAYASLYHLEDSAGQTWLRLNDSWRAFLVENLGVIQSFSEHRLALYLQARNPNVPGIVNKLRAPTARQLTSARNFWRLIRRRFAEKGESGLFKDIYSERPLSDNFSIDHFLPWSFVVHDLLWNLTPAEPATNSSKGDSVPDIDLYLPSLARLHFAAIGFAKERPKLIEDHTDCFKRDIPGLVAMGESTFMVKYREVILPQAQIAMNQGFQSG